MPYPEPNKAGHDPNTNIFTFSVTQREAENLRILESISIFKKITSKWKVRLFIIFNGLKISRKYGIKETESGFYFLKGKP